METDENRIQDPQTSSYLSASDLMSFRKGNDEQFSCVVGQKLYNRTRTVLEEQALECVLESHKDTLNQKRASRICDLMQAEWNKDLNLAIISKLKGKYAHHMGHTIDGKIGFSPEEAMFLLENRAIEIMNDKMPMSTEEGYAIMLKGNMGIEKYHVYSHLSQLGFIVVRHRTEFETVSGEKSADVNKQQTTRKRKHSTDLPEVHKEKRLTFAGALLNHNDKENNEIEMSTLSVNREENSTSSDCQFLKINDTAVCDETLKSTENAVSSTTNENEGTKSAEPLSFACASQNFGDYSFNEKRTVGEDNAEVVLPNDVIQTDGMVDKMQLSSENAASSVSTDDKGSKNVDHSFGESRESITVESTGDGNSNELVHDSHDKNASATRENDLMLPDSCNAIGITSGEESIEITDGGINQERSYFQDQDDIMSFSSEGNESDVISFDGDSSKGIVRENEDDEVTLLEVKKKETKPLAVIDLLSDEEQGNMEVEGENAQSDDEIQIVKVCTGSSSYNKSSGRKIENRNFVECKKEEKTDVLARSQKLSPPRMQFPFPDLFRKDLACLRRPPSFLLPRNVRPAKEAYILDFKKQCNEQSRLWNSYREVQDYQRARRRGMMPDPSSNKFQRFLIRRSQDPNFRRNYDSSRDHQSQTFNHHEQNDNQTVSSSQSRDFDCGSFSSGRDNYATNSSNNDVTSSSSSVTVRHQERSVGLFGIQQQPLFPNPLLPMNIPMPNFQNMFSSNDLVSEFHRTAYGVASSLLSAMLSQNMIPTPLLEFQTQQQGRTIFNFNDPNNSDNLNGQRSNGFMSSSSNTEHRCSPQNLMGCNSFSRNISTDSSYSRHRFNNSSREEPGFLLPMPNGRRNRRDFRQRNYANRGKPFPCPYSHLNKKSSWNEVKAVVEKRNENACGNDSNSDIEEVPINVNQVLWSNDIQPLVKPGMKYPTSEVLQSLKVTQMANLLNRETENERYLPTTSYLEIAFDVYLPATNYKKTCPGIPKHRVIVVRSTDPFPKYSEVVHLQKKWNDGAFLQLAVVDNGDISFFSFNSISLPVMIPHEP